MKNLRASIVDLVLTVAIAASVTTKPANPAVSHGQLDSILQAAVDQRKVPGIAAAVATADRVVYQGAAGKRDVRGNAPMTGDSVFRIASMTKPITSVAVMQLVERGLVKLDEPASMYLPELSQIQVLESFDPKTRQSKLRPPKTALTVKHLLTHTSGFGYEFFDPLLMDYVASGAVPSIYQGGDGFLKAPLLFDPGSRWEYGISVDWLGKLVEAVSKQTLEEYFRQHIFEPLGMSSSFFNIPAEKQSRLVTLHQRKPDGRLEEIPGQPFQLGQFFSGGGGLHSTVTDYLRFTRMILGNGQLGRARILRPETIALMAQNQIGDFTLQQFKSLVPQLTKEVPQMPGSPDKFGLGFARNSTPVPGGRAAGSLGWSGIYNTYFWIDPQRQICAVLMMQILPFGDDAPIAVLAEFERAVYASFSKKNNKK